MTGTILSLLSAGRSGSIRASDGSRLTFAAEAVLGDFDTLAIGHRVTFDVEDSGASRRAIRVFHEPMRMLAPIRRVDAPPDLRYAGFRQAEGVRTYRFDAVSTGKPVQHSILLDTTLLIKHHIGMQEVPALCVKKVMSDLRAHPESVSHEIGDDDLREIAGCRDEERLRKAQRHAFAGRRGAPPPPPAARKPLL